MSDYSQDPGSEQIPRSYREYLLEGVFGFNLTNYETCTAELGTGDDAFHVA